MPAAKAPMDGAGVICSVVTPLTSKGRNFRIVADADFTELANIIQIFFDNPAKHVGFFASFNGDDAALFHVARHRLLVR